MATDSKSPTVDKSDVTARLPKPSNLGDVVTDRTKVLTDVERGQLEEQNKRMVTPFQAQKLEHEARKHWDLFYKRNDTRFFKDRHWTTREFSELLSENPAVPGTLADGTRRNDAENQQKTLLEVGCGVGNLIFPLIEDGHRDYFIYACDLSPRAVELLPAVVANIFRLIKPGGMVLFRDYGRYDMAQLRFKAGHKIGENFYVRQDGTRSYYFAEDEVATLFRQAGFAVLLNSYIHRRTINAKENIDVPRIFVQGKFQKPPQPE
ncbi:tRNA N(3)-methylcytidine methyltransferase METTL6 isoform X2 [Anopheles bellator]|uniref:tRNA N(3)-methylcytidine methyltransferase METTL6 isoform X2 n=1 Tax=Anopheles bellator TaxID=139047 RepID=UPI0026471146|nr:tRNA N(3)-methylcytidine methyltransferase METTL6 isoform X2 [Anopheles bellator]